MIDNILGLKRKAADERARARAMIRARGGEIERPDGYYYATKYVAPCECGSMGEVYESSWTRTTEEWVARCEACGMFEVVRLARVAAR